MSFWSSLFYRNTNTIIVLDISSASVGGVLVDNKNGVYNKNAKLMVREEIVFKSDIDYKWFLSGTLETASKVTTQLLTNFNSRVDEIHCVLGSPWFISKSRAINFKTDKPLKITRELLRRLVKTDVENFKYEETKEGSIKLGSLPVILEVKTTSIRLNGYETTTPIGKEAQEITINTIISLWSSDAKDAFTGALIGATGHGNVYFHTFPSVAVSSLSALSVVPDKYLFVDISGEISDIISIDKNSLVEISSFPLGRNFAIRWIAREMNVSPDQAVTMLSLYFSNKLHNDSKKHLDDVVAYIRKEWLTNFQNALEKSYSEYLLPRDVYLLARTPDLELLFADVLKSDTLSKYIHSNRPFKVTMVDERLITQNDSATSTTTRFDLYLQLEALFINKLFS